jgi:hypothetical protein
MLEGQFILHFVRYMDGGTNHLILNIHKGSFIQISNLCNLDLNYLEEHILKDLLNI